MNARSLGAVRVCMLSSGAVEALKWVALLAMVVDHVNAAFYGRDLGAWATIIGRVAMPVFSLVLAYNLARPGADLVRCLRRLFLFGVLSLPAHAYVFAVAGGWWPLNILFTFAVAVGCVELMKRKRAGLAVALFLVGGAAVEYWWPGVALVVAAWAYFMRPQSGTAWTLAAAMLGLCVVNFNGWALLALPLVALAALVDVRVPRLRWVFWWFYPLHFVVIAFVLVAVPVV